MIFINCIDDTKKNFIETISWNDKNITKLEKELIYNSELKYDITFSNVKSLPDTIIKMLVNIQDSTTIYVTQQTLFLYLISLNFRVRFLTNSVSKDEKKNIKAICIGCSSNSLNKLVQIISELPYVDISLFVSIHVLPNIKSELIKDIERNTKYKVIEPINSQKIEPNCIYISPSYFHMMVKGDYIYLSHKGCVNYSSPSIDILFDSISKTYKQNAIAILISGYIKDDISFLENFKKTRCNRSK
jgi:chemotaxis response regulator CheB